MMNVTERNCHLDLGLWQSWLERERFPVAEAWVGVLGRADHGSKSGRLLAWRTHPDRVEVVVRAYAGQADDDIAVLLVLDEEAERHLLSNGAEALGLLVRQGRLHAFMLRTLDGLEEVGLSEFVEDLGLVFPRH